METTNEAVNCTEYKIGNTTYYVETHFNLQAESLDEIIERKCIFAGRKVLTQTKSI